MFIKSSLKYASDFRIILVAILYFGSAWLGYSLAFPDNHSLPVWPPSGLAFALIILLGRSSWPGITIGAVIANLLAYWNNESLSQQSIIIISAFVSIGQTLEALVGNFLVQRWIKEPYPFGRTRNTFQFLFVTLVMGVIGSLFVTFSLYLTQVITIDQLVQNGLNGWASRVVGILLFTPFILAIAYKRFSGWQTEKLIEGIVFIACMAGIYFLVQFGPFNGTLIRALPYLLIPFLLWLAFRFDLLAAITVTLAASLTSIYFTIQNQGPFILTSSTDTMLLLQIFIGVVSISTIVLSATVTERSSTQEELKEFNTNLEAMVLQRTKALNDEISSRKETESKLIQTNEELSKRNTELDNFVYSVSHDLRAPIASVLGLINLAKQDNDPEMQKIYLEKISSSALQQDNFIREILDHSRNSRLEVRKEAIRFKNVIDETFDQLKFATSTGKAVKRIVKVNQDEDFFTDRWRLKVILNNIISNAIRYRNGRDPVIKVNVDIHDHKALVEIEDNGRGIPKEHLDKVCNMFYRATDDGAGSGLGLYIVKETIDKLNGNIQIESEEGKGTTIRLAIPEIVS
jgi:signal transduction histidine kinase